MRNHFTCKPAGSVYFGPGRLLELPRLARAFGRRLLLLTGGASFKRNGTCQQLVDALSSEGFTLLFEEVVTEPSPECIDAIVGRHRASVPDLIASIGGGSVLDAGKAVSAMLTCNNSVVHYLEGVGDLVPDGKKVPFIAVPTTAGTGSEATSNAVLSRSGPEGFKKSLRHDRYVPDVALIDPELMLSCPPGLTAACGMDTFTQLVEGFLSGSASPFTDAIAWSGIEAVQRGLVAAFINGEDIGARSAMAYASLCSGIVLASAGLGVVHGMAPVLGSKHGISHGVVCGSLMAAANEESLRELEKTGQNKAALEKYCRLGRLFSPAGEHSDAYYRQAFIEQLHQMTDQLALPRLGRFNISEQDVEALAAGSANKNNPVKLSPEAIGRIIRSRL